MSKRGRVSIGAGVCLAIIAGANQVTPVPPSIAVYLGPFLWFLSGMATLAWSISDGPLVGARKRAGASKMAYFFVGLSGALFAMGVWSVFGPPKIEAPLGAHGFDIGPFTPSTLEDRPESSMPEKPTGEASGDTTYGDRSPIIKGNNNTYVGGDVVQGPRPPTFRFFPKSPPVKEEDGFLHTYVVVIDSDVVLKEATVQAYASSVFGEPDIWPANMQRDLHARDGVATVTIPNAQGEYVFTFKTKVLEPVTINVFLP